jgi:hypothetical protein
MRLHLKIVALALVAGLAACTAAPIYNVENATVVSGAGKPYSATEVRAAIVRASTKLGWQMRDEGPNKLVGSIQLRGHSAVVNIPYNSQSYSILYRSSTDLGEKDGKIHKNYNGWIQNLTREINSQLNRP